MTAKEIQDLTSACIMVYTGIENDYIIRMVKEKAKPKWLVKLLNIDNPKRWKFRLLKLSIGRSSEGGRELMWLMQGWKKINPPLEIKYPEPKFE